MTHRSHDQFLSRSGPQNFLDGLNDEEIGEGQGNQEVFQHLGPGRGEAREAGKRRQGSFQHLHHQGVDEHRADHGQADEIDPEVLDF